MKQVIDGKRYDTDTAKFIGEDSYGSPADFSYWREELYQKRTGEFFIHGKGGAMSKYAESIGQSEWRGGEKIIPLDFGHARDWSEKHLSADEYEKIFGEVEEDETKKPVMLKLPGEVVELLARAAAETGKTRSDIVAEAIREFLA